MADLTITGVSQKYNIKADTLRYYERIGLIPEVPRNSHGNRYYNDGMQGWIEMIVCLRHSGVTIEKLLDYVGMLKQGDSTLGPREELLKEQLSELKKKRFNLNRSIRRLEHKISLYDSGEIKKGKSYFEEYKIMDD
ncbi:MerR family transcriptional regulator [Limosilactobacillus sp. STM2_1]|uniref:MerR family transcriptional regulator n=1 Tax=Limosilactobacillus rudii TaxID=2759755 RepID=A0A7W3UJA8_9LACO|nr:MerR family transcriptional regulator [Limosilactobacillus rudii]MBB1078493.1 MerR family transcriptional regulator [Limosilactobacillus rudii]MBB1096623.1 MerR family transcriptional regulator [Limosilactobacillus rudii]MCD7134182.1 MerR family transcriptional regulator [Limosilactobacillus rudii]